MSYIGRKPTVGNFQICDAISVVNGQAAYTMQVGSVNVSPQSANHMIVSLNGTIQKPNSSFTVSGSTITFSSNLVTNDVIDFIQILGDVLDLGVPSDATVTSAKIVDDSVTLAKMASGTDGNIISYDASGNPVAVATGSAGQILTSAGAGAPPTFAAAAAGGLVKSVASDMNMADFSTTSASFVDVTDYYVDITPEETSNNVLILFNFNAYVPVGGQYYAARIKRTISGGSSTEIGHGTYGLAFARAVSAHDFWGGNSIMYFDSPNTTSSVRYQIQWSNAGSTGGAYLGANSSNVNKLFAMEFDT